jgi:glycosyltransferase involved in cell wall biosynthesis
MADFVLLATADWDHPLWTNKQHVAMSLTDLGHRVLYVESIGLRAVRPDRTDARRILRRLRRGLRPPRRIRPGLWVWSPLVLPGGSAGLALTLNRLILRLGLAAAVRRTGLQDPLLWTFNPLVHTYLRLSRFRATVYQCVDRVQAQPGMPADLINTAERELCRRADVVFTTAPQLQDDLVPFNAATHYFGNVADADHFGRALEGSLPCPPELAAIPAPLLMFIGAIDAYKLDLPMLEALARATPAWSYVLIGPVGETDPGTDVRGLLGLGNVHLLGPRPYADLPAHLAQAAVALLPLRHNDYTRNMYPMKFFEYLAAGCPVVATAIPSLADQWDVALLREPMAEAFEEAIRLALEGQGPPLERRLARAGLHTYLRRTEAMLEVLRSLDLLPPEPGSRPGADRSPK